jgi:hypothetical protein
VIGLALGSCTLLDPYETIPLRPSNSQDARQRVGVCYDALSVKPEQLLAVAQDACGKKMTPMREDTDYGIHALDYCPILLPGRATFVCQPNK